MITRGIALAFVGAMLSLTAWAQDYAGRTVDEVRLNGLGRISEQLVRSKLEVQPAQALSPGAIARDIRRIYDLGYFEKVDAQASEEASRLVVIYSVVEKRMIREIKIIGNKKVRTRVIQGAISWKEGDSFVEGGYPEERDAIVKACAQKGFPNASVDIVAENIGPGLVRLTYSIHEGAKARVKSVTFEGNTVLTDRQLRKMMKTRRAFWFLGGKYDETQFEADLKKVIDEYGNYGRLEAQIANTDLTYRDSGKGMDIVIRLAEGPEYKVEGLEVAGNQVFDTDEVERLVKVKAGDVHNKGQVTEDADTINKGYEDSGYINSQVAPQVTLDRENKTTHIVHRVIENDLRYIKEIKITGNSITRDEVIRREMLANPGERFDGSMLRLSQRSLDNMDYFDDIRMTMEDVPGDDRFSNLLLDVDEGKTGSFNFGVGYSTEDKFGGSVELNLRNFDISNWPSFHGGGQQFRAKISLGQVNSQYSISFTDPEFLGYPLSFGVDLFDESHDEDAYEEDTRGGQLRFGKVLSPYVMTRLALRYSDVEISDIPAFSWPRIRRESTDGSTTSIAWGINRNTTDIRRDPSTGSVHDFQIELAGLGGDYDFYKVEHDSAWYWALDKKNQKWVLSFRTREDYSDNYGSSDFIPISFRYFAGGTSTVRGYDSGDIGPQERRFVFWGDRQALGGEVRVLENLELKYKLNKMLRLYTFVDAGGVWSEGDDFDLGDMKYSAGIGVGVDIPKMGPIRIDYGFPLNPEDWQGSGRLHLTSGLKF